MLTPDQEAYLADLADIGLAEQAEAAARQVAINAAEQALGEATVDGA